MIIRIQNPGRRNDHQQIGLVVLSKKKKIGPVVQTRDRRLDDAAAVEEGAVQRAGQREAATRQDNAVLASLCSARFFVELSLFRPSALSIFGIN